MTVVIVTRNYGRGYEKSCFSCGVKKSLILELLKKNIANEKDFEIVSKEERTNKIIAETKKLNETDAKVFVK